MKLIETKTLGTAAASIEFTSIPQTFTDLVCLISASTDNTSTRAVLSFNTGGTYTVRMLFGTGTTVGSNTEATHFRVTNNTEANTFASSEIYIPNYTLSNAKSFSTNAVTEQNTSFSVQSIIAGLWSETSAITSIGLTPILGNFTSGSVFSLYGITKGSDGITTAS
jgi:hypothetical protein